MAKSAKLGQNFLRDMNIARKIVALLEAAPEPLLEIGAGHGSLSGLLLKKYPGRQVTLVEIDPVLVQELESLFANPEGPHQVGRARVLAADILHVDLAEMFPQTRVDVIGNLPYHISKPVVDWLIQQREKVRTAVLMLQKDFIDKLLAPRGGLSPAGGKKYNAQSVVFQLLFTARRCFDVPRGAFAPAPKVLSTVLAIQPAGSALGQEADEFYRFVRLCFAERRKTLWNNLAAQYDKKALPALAAACGLSPQARAEQLPADRFPPLYAALKKCTGEKRK